MLKNFIFGIIFALVMGMAGAYLFISLGCMPANADSKPGWLETWMARKSLRASIKREAPPTPNPQTLNDANLISGVKLYAVNCAVCHGAADGKPSNIALGLYQHAPQLTKHGVEDDPDGKIYWYIKHGVRLTGMPGFSGTLTEEQIWNITLFLKNMDSLPPKAKKVWESIPSFSSKP